MDPRACRDACSSMTKKKEERKNHKGGCAPLWGSLNFDIEWKILVVSSQHVLWGTCLSVSSAAIKDKYLLNSSVSLSSHSSILCHHRWWDYLLQE